MNEPGDDRLIEKMRGDISQANKGAAETLCLLLSCVEKFSDKLEFGFVLGRLFSVITEGALIEDNVVLSYDEKCESLYDFRIEEELKNFTCREKAAIWAILHGASNPMSLDKIEAISLRNL
jgi:hypothetical protein